MNYSGKNKLASELNVGDFVTVTGFSSDVAEIESIEPVGNTLIVLTSNGKSARWNPNKLVRTYEDG